MFTCWCWYVYVLLLIWYVYMLMLACLCIIAHFGVFTCWHWYVYKYVLLILVCLHVHVGMFTCCYRYVYMSLLTLVCIHVRFCHLEGEVEEQHNMNQSILYNHGMPHTLNSLPSCQHHSTTMVCHTLLIPYHHVSITLQPWYATHS